MCMRKCADLLLEDVQVEKRIEKGEKCSKESVSTLKIFDRGSSLWLEVL